MNTKKDKNEFSKNSKFILALHSSTDQLGVGLIHLDGKKETFKNSIFPIGRNLSSHLFKYIADLLPAIRWSQIVRIAVATGPGGYTGTRITIIFARTVGQQINCQVDGISSFELMIPRLASSMNSYEIREPFWITRSLKSNILIGGKYKIHKQRESDKIFQVEELISPCLITSNIKIDTGLRATDNIKKDIVRLLEISLNFYKQQKLSSWKNLLPIYPTSPVKYNNEGN